VTTRRSIAVTLSLSNWTLLALLLLTLLIMSSGSTRTNDSAARPAVSYNVFGVDLAMDACRSRAAKAMRLVTGDSQPGVEGEAVWGYGRTASMFITCEDVSGTTTVAIVAAGARYDEVVSFHNRLERAMDRDL